jgi:hypothetical protein
MQKFPHARMNTHRSGRRAKMNIVRRSRRDAVDGTARSAPADPGNILKVKRLTAPLYTTLRGNPEPVGKDNADIGGIRQALFPFIRVRLRLATGFKDTLQDFGVLANVLGEFRQKTEFRLKRLREIITHVRKIVRIIKF